MPSSLAVISCPSPRTFCKVVTGLPGALPATTLDTPGSSCQQSCARTHWPPGLGAPEVAPPRLHPCTSSTLRLTWPTWPTWPTWQAGLQECTVLDSAEGPVCCAVSALTCSCQGTSGREQARDWSSAQKSGGRTHLLPRLQSGKRNARGRRWGWRWFGDSRRPLFRQPCPCRSAQSGSARLLLGWGAGWGQRAVGALGCAGCRGVWVPSPPLLFLTITLQSGP